MTCCCRCRFHFSRANLAACAAPAVLPPEPHGAVASIVRAGGQTRGARARGVGVYVRRVCFWRALERAGVRCMRALRLDRNLAGIFFSRRIILANTETPNRANFNHTNLLFFLFLATEDPVILVASSGYLVPRVVGQLATVFCKPNMDLTSHASSRLSESRTACLQGDMGWMWRGTG